MKSRSDDSKRKSRRQFTKAVAAALAAAPFVGVQAQGKRGASSGPAAGRQCGEGVDIKRLEMRPVAPPRGRPRCSEGCSAQGPIVRTDHVPPPVFFGDSLHLEFGHKLRELPGTPGPADRPKHHVIEVPDAAHQYGEIARVHVITEYEEQFSYWYYDFPEGYGAQLQLWLQDVGSTTLPAQPQVVVKGNVPFDFGGNVGQKRTMLIECSERLGNSRPSHKKYRSHRNDLTTHQGGREFRIGRWRIVDESGSASGFGSGTGTPADKFTFMVSVYRP